MTAPAPKPRPLPRKTLASVVGLSAAAALLTLTPQEESGRTVAVTMKTDGTATVRHVAGKQYLKTYLDIVGVPTICDGLTRGVRLNQQLTEQQCAEKLEDELVAKSLEVKACAPSLWKPGTDNQRVASILLAYNIGGPGFCQSSARNLFETGQPRAACDRFLPWNKGTFPASAVARQRAKGETCTRNAKGVWKCTIRGLTERRERERKHCLKGLAA